MDVDRDEIAFFERRDIGDMIPMGMGQQNFFRDELLAFEWAIRASKLLGAGSMKNAARLVSGHAMM